MNLANGMFSSESHYEFHRNGRTDFEVNDQ
jgi:hypothetical protein